MRKEYGQWPGLALTIPQAARLWNADEHTCASAFQALVRVGFLTRREDGRFARRDQAYQRQCPWCRVAA
jgi:hypothetical protein